MNERTRPLFMSVHLTKRTKFLVRVRLFNKRTNFPPNNSRTVSFNVRFICSTACYNNSDRLFIVT
ncbi:hypothetical protein HanIR_Chr03g0147521 [Helianthus annuus]|nr:hypothetical protein HanIR_Chr03g0147521 [Helianthus annuus]